MKLSIITVNLNNLTGLKKTMSSVFTQSFSDFEYIVIDGGSTDGSREYIDKHSQKIAYGISEHDTGVYNAMNKGICKAKGDYLLFLNSGDVLLHDHILLEVNAYLKDYDVVYGNLMFDYGDHRTHMEYPKELSAFYLFENYLPHPASFLRKNLFDRIGLYDEQYKICADWAFFVLAICGYSATYLHIDHIISIYDMNGMSANPANFPIIRLEKEKFMKSEFYVYFKDFKNFNKLRKDFDNINTDLMNIKAKKSRSLLSRFDLR